MHDIPVVRQLIWETWLATYKTFIPEEDIRSYFEERYSTEDLAALFLKPGIEGFIARTGGRIGGEAINKLSEEEQRYYVSSLYVLPELHGRGLGSALLARAERQARKHHHDRIWLGVMSKNEASVAWYRRKGFVFTEELPFTMGKTTVQHLIGYKLCDNC